MVVEGVRIPSQGEDNYHYQMHTWLIPRRSDVPDRSFLNGGVVYREGSSVRFCSRRPTDRATGLYPVAWGFKSLRERQLKQDLKGRENG